MSLKTKCPHGVPLPFAHATACLDCEDTALGKIVACVAAGHTPSGKGAVALAGGLTFELCAQCGFVYAPVPDAAPAKVAPTKCGPTHHAGCDCYEAQRNTEIAELRRALNHKEGLVESWRRNAGERDAEISKLNEELSAAKSAIAVLEDQTADAAKIIRELRQKLAIAGVEGSPPPGEVGTIQRLERELQEARLERDEHAKQCADAEKCRDNLRTELEKAKIDLQYLMEKADNFGLPMTAWQPGCLTYDQLEQKAAKLERVATQIREIHTRLSAMTGCATDGQNAVQMVNALKFNFERKIAEARPDSRILDLVQRLVAVGNKAEHLSASELLEIAEYVEKVRNLLA